MQYVYVLCGLFLIGYTILLYVALHSSLTVCTRITRPGPPGAPDRTNSGPPERDGGKINTSRHWGHDTYICDPLVFTCIHSCITCKDTPPINTHSVHNTLQARSVFICVEISDRTSPNMISSVTFKINKLTNKYTNKPIELLLFGPL